MNELYSKTGYLSEEFKIFYNKDSRQRQFDFHYHDFHKLLFFLGGNVSYMVEGKRYELMPGDIILVRAGEIHKPVIHDNTPYERMIAYLSPAYFEKYRGEGCDLYACFQKTMERGSNLIRQKKQEKGASAELNRALHALVSSFSSQEYAQGLYQEVKLAECLILLNRISREPLAAYPKPASGNATVLAVLNLINDNLTSDINIDSVADRMHLSRSYLMHLFKKETGCTIGQYITEKRLFIARRYIVEGMGVTDACYRSGFRSYASFYHAFSQKYGSLPREAGRDID